MICTSSDLYYLRKNSCNIVHIDLERPYDKKTKQQYLGVDVTLKDTRIAYMNMI